MYDEIEKRFHWATIPRPLMPERSELIYKFPMQNKVMDDKGRVWDWIILEGKMIWRYLYVTMPEYPTWFFVQKSRLSIFRSKKNETNNM